MQRWSEHFGVERVVQEEVLQRIAQRDVKMELDVLPSCAEVKKAIAQLKSHEARGIDGIPAEVYKEGGDVLLNKLTDLLSACWEKGTVPQDF